jgi:predicted MFS family arabinose efflux permease
MKGQPHYFLIGLIIAYIYWLFIDDQAAEMNKGLYEAIGGYLGWLTTDRASSKQMTIVLMTLIGSLFFTITFSPNNVLSVFGLIIFIAVGWFGSLNSKFESF